MDTQISASRYIEEAIEILSSIEKKPISRDERVLLSIHLATFLMKEANMITTPKEKSFQQHLNSFAINLNNKAFIFNLIDQCFRTKNKNKTATQILHLINQYGIPASYSLYSYTKFYLFKLFGKNFPSTFIPIISHGLQKDFNATFRIADDAVLKEYAKKMGEKNIPVNFTRLGEFAIGNNCAKNKLNIYQHDLKQPYISSISIKPSLLLAQINANAYENSIDTLSDNFRTLFRSAIMPDSPNKQIIIDLDKYDHMSIVVEAFIKVLTEEEFLNFSCGIVLQSYFPDSFSMQKKLTSFAINRKNNGGAPIIIRLVKGAYLNYEQVIASKKRWKQASFLHKIQTDANFKRMLEYGLKDENAKAANINIATHNIFDLAYALLLTKENDSLSYVTFEMYEGRVQNIRKALHKLIPNNLSICCPIFTTSELYDAISHILRRIEENASPENFLHQSKNLYPGTPIWEELENSFLHSCKQIDTLQENPRRKQNRFEDSKIAFNYFSFDNDPITDFSSENNRQWANKLIEKWKNYKPTPIPITIKGKDIFLNEKGKGFSPSNPNDLFYTYSLAEEKEINIALNTAKANEHYWQNIHSDEKQKIFIRLVELFKEKRDEIIGIIMADVGKTFKDADIEVSAAIDSLEYHRLSLERIKKFKDLSWTPKGTFFIASCWDNPCSKAVANIIAALITNNCVIFKPSPKAVLIGWKIVNLFWEAGICKEILQFINCTDETISSTLLSDSRLSAAIYNCHSITAQKLIQKHPLLDFYAAANGKNFIIISSISDYDLAIKNLVLSAFEFAG